MKKYQYGICGAFDFEEKGTGGQSVKTREFYKALCAEEGEENVAILESTDYKRNPASFFFRMLRLMKNCSCVIILPANKGIRVFAPLCTSLKKITGTKIYYNVIGGWLAQLCDDHKELIKHLSRFDGILVETNKMKAELEIIGLKNIYVLANFKEMVPVSDKEIKTVGRPVKLCYFSRVTAMKGIADAVEVVNRINEESGDTVCTFDIYGPVADGYDEEFEKLKRTFSNEIHYMGSADPKTSVQIIGKYDIQLFPTRYRTEGIPGSILDSYFAGVPVVAARWNSYSDIVIENETGIGFEIENRKDFYKKLTALIADTEKINYMKHRALKESEQYLPQTVIRRFLKIAGS